MLRVQVSGAKVLGWPTEPGLLKLRAQQHVCFAASARCEMESLG